MRHSRVILSFFVLALVLATGCSDSSPTPASTAPQTAQTTENGSSEPAQSGSTPSLSTASETTETTVVDSTSSTTAPPVDSALQVMTVEQKAAQVLLVSFDGTSLNSYTKATISQAAPGGFLLLGRNVTGKEQLRLLAAALQRTAGAAGAPGLFIAADQEGGRVTRVKEGVPEVPSARALASEASPTEAGALAEQTAAGLRAQGVNMVLAPVADVVADRSSFLFNRSFAGEPSTVSAFVAAVTRGFEEGGLVTVTKHFPGHGSAAGNSHTSAPTSTASEADFERIHLPPFRAAIEAGVDGVMLGHLLVPAYDGNHLAPQSRAIVGELLGTELGFAGLVVADDLEMAGAVGGEGEPGTAVATEVGEAAVAALAAGCDLLITTGTGDRQALIRQAIMEAVRSGTLSEERLDQAVRRILTVKFEHSIPISAGAE